MIVLLVEDDPTLSQAFATILEEQPGIRKVECVHNLAEALVRLREGGVSVILLDLGLSDATGLESVRRLQTEAPEVPVVVITGSGEFELATILAGAQDFVEKGGITGDEMARRLRIAFERHRVRGLYQPFKDKAGQIKHTLDKLDATLEALPAKKADKAKATPPGSMTFDEVNPKSPCPEPPTAPRKEEGK